MNMTTDFAVTFQARLENTTYTDESQKTISDIGVSSPSWAVGLVVQLSMLFMGIFGFFANLTILISLFVYREATKKTINIFVCNQTVLDLVHVLFGTITLTMYMSDYLQSTTGVLRLLL